MGVRVYHKLDLAALQRILRDPNGGVMRDLNRRGDNVKRQAQANLEGASGPRRVDTGRLSSSIYVKTVIGANLGVQIGTNVRYAKWVEEGTGIYGPRGSYIVPKRGKYLRFKPKGYAKFVFAKRVRGMQKNEFMKNALRAAAD